MTTNLKVLVSCATSAVTSTLMMDRVQKLAHRVGISVTVYKCLGQELPAKIKLYSPIFVLTTLSVKGDYGIPILSGIPYLTGVGANSLDEKIVSLLRNVEQ